MPCYVRAIVTPFPHPLWLELLTQGSRMEGESRLKDAEVASLDAGLRERGRQLEAEQGEQA